MTPILSVFLKFFFVISKNNGIEFGSTDRNIKFISVEVAIGIGVANNFLHSRALKFVQCHCVPQIKSVVRMGIERNDVTGICLHCNFPVLINGKNFAASAVANTDLLIIFQANNSVAD